jgi:hypothetical protein
MSPIERFPIARGTVLALSVSVASLLLLTPTVPAHAETSRRADEVCNSKVDNRSADGKVSAVWQTCVKTSGWAHGTLSMECWGGTVFWSRTKCTVLGSFEISKDGDVIKSGDFAGSSDEYGYLTLSQRFTYSCQGSGNYTFTIRNAHAGFYHTQEGHPTNTVQLPERSVSNQGC